MAYKRRIEQRVKFFKNGTLKCSNLEKANIMVFNKRRRFLKRMKNKGVAKARIQNKLCLWL